MSTILITGASNGIGRAFALACAASGRYTKILLNGGHDAAALEETARRVAAAGDLVCIPDLGDVGDLAYVETSAAASGRWTRWSTTRRFLSSAC